jgi:hypothetical protein
MLSGVYESKKHNNTNINNLTMKLSHIIVTPKVRTLNYFNSLQKELLSEFISKPEKSEEELNKEKQLLEGDKMNKEKELEDKPMYEYYIYDILYYHDYI